ncbi:MAG: hypothetical protein KDE53_14800, partial [Caldilineaceae bacterium]|nr:hypothetical protein [Caldilineaceae bacterium]
MMATLQIHLLGTPRIEIAGREVRLPRRKGLALLAFLAVTGEVQRRDTLATLLWPESNQSMARGALRRELSSLRATLPGEWLLVDKEHVALDWDAGIWLDSAVFKTLLALPHEGAAPLIEQLVAAVDLYRGEFLAGFSLSGCPEFDDWQFFEADGYRQAFLRTLDDLVVAYRQQGNNERAIVYGRRRLAVDVLHEPAHRTLMELYALDGQQTAALRQYEECVRICAEEFGAQPEERTTALYEAIRTRRFPEVNVPDPSPSVQNLSQPEQATETGRSPSHNLPRMSSSFVGREVELSELLALLSRPDVRLLTCVAPGGMGKTRLVIEAARQSISRYTDGVWFLSLVGVNEGSQFLSALLQLFDVPMGQSEAREAILRFLRQRRLLLVLDNFEQLVDSAPFLADIVNATLAVDLLVTSRLRLNMREEWLFPLEGLATAVVPAETAQVLQSDALTLFTERARQIRPDFDLATERTHATYICQQVSGMPLGIELATTWLRAMNCAEIAVEIAQDIDFLSTTLRNMPEQHRSMRAVFARSWKLLTQPEQRALARLSAFQGGFTRQAAWAVTETGLPLLSALVDHSLLRHTDAGR